LNFKKGIIHLTPCLSPLPLAGEGAPKGERVFYKESKAEPSPSLASQASPSPASGRGDRQGVKWIIPFLKFNIDAGVRFRGNGEVGNAEIVG
jgi:hypothetical protein